MKKLMLCALCMITLIYMLTGCFNNDKTGEESVVYEVNEEYLNGEWRIDSPENHGVDTDTLNRLEMQVKEDPILSVVIVKDGYVIYEYYKDGYGADSVFVLNSCTKSVTSAVFGMALDRNNIQGVDVKIEDYFPEIGQSDSEEKKSITIEQLLNFTSGLNWPEWGRWNYGFGNWLDADDWVEFVLNRKMDSYPGDTFNYNTGSAHLVSAIIQKSVGESMRSYAEKNLFEPLGMTSVEWFDDPQGVTSGGFGIAMTSRDAARFGQLYVNKGKWGDRRIVSEEWVLESTKAHASGSPYFGDYGYLWWVSTAIGDKSYDMYFAMGFAGQYIIVVPDINLVTVITSDFAGDKTTVPLSYFHNFIMQAISR